MALYATLRDHQQDASCVLKESPAPVQGESSATTQPSTKLESGSSPDAIAKWRCYGILYGFWPTLTYVVAILAILVWLNVHWCYAGSMGFAQLDPLVAVEPSNMLPGPGWLLASRVVWLLATVFPLIFTVRNYRRNQKAKGESLILGGVEILLMFCTLWTWCSKAVYFSLATIASSLYVAFGCLPSSVLTRSLWVSFDISFGMTWLVFWACWLILIPVAWLLGKKAILGELLSFKCLYVHNFNVVIMLVELLFSSWTVNIEHCIFPIYFGIAYVFFNWWLHSKIQKWIYFFLDYDRAYSIPVCLLLVAIITGSFWSGARVAAALGKA